VRNSYVTVTRVPTVDRIKTAKVTFAVATPDGSLIVTDRGRVPAPAMSKIALGVPARKVRGVTMMFRVRERAGQRPADQNYCDDADDWTCDHLQAFTSAARSQAWKPNPRRCASRPKAIRVSSSTIRARGYRDGGF
jgi:hypothetical protein